MTATKTETRSVYDVVRENLEHSFDNGISIAQHFILYSLMTSSDEKLRAIADEYGAKWQEKIKEPDTIKDIMNYEGETELACLMALKNNQT